MSTKLSDDIPDICGEEICGGSEETVSVYSGDDGSETEGEEEPPGIPGPRGRADSGALLDMLAEVASQKLLFSPMKRDQRRDSEGKLSAAQVKNLSTNQLIQIFSTTEFDEMRKWYTYICAFDEDCSMKFHSFGNENRAKERFKEHLFTHLQEVQGKALPVGKRRTSASSRKPRRNKQKELEDMQAENQEEEAEENQEQGEEVDEEMIETVEEEEIEFEDGEVVSVKQEWDDQIFLSTEPENKVEVEIVGQESQEASSSSGAVVDLNRLIAGLSEKMGVSADHSYSTANTDYVVYVVEGDTETLLKAPPVAHQVDVTSDSEYSVVRSAELPIIHNKRSMASPPASAFLDPSAVWELNNGENIERDEFRHRRKPKGKAKFIGQSRHEKEMALEAMEAIRMKTGGGIDSLRCTICQPPRTFTAPTTLISHYRSHAGIKPYSCRVCGSVFTRQHSLNYHMLIHQNQTRFTCNDCGRKFRHPSHFREHRRRHTGESPFECSDCLMRFKTRNTYKRHLRTRHGKVLTTSGGLIILSEEEFMRVRTSPRTQLATSPARRGRVRKITSTDKMNEHAVDFDEDMQALHQLEIVNSNEGYEGSSMEDMEEMPPDFLVEDGSAAYEEIVKEAVRLERAEAATSPNMKEEHQHEETLVIETEDPLSGSGLYLATLEDGETVLVNTRDDDSDDGSGRGRVDFKLLEVGKVTRDSDREPTVIVIKNEHYS